MKKCYIVIGVLLLISTSAYAQTQLTFNLSELPKVHLGNVGVRGNCAPLSWDKSMPLVKNGDSYVVTIDFPKPNEELEFKFVQYDNDQDPVWETIENRTVSLTDNAKLTSNCLWNKEEVIDVKSLKPITSEALMKDFELIQTMVMDVHPGTYRYNSKEEIESALGNLKSSFRQSLSYGEAYLAISELTAKLKCEHTKAGFNNQNKVVNSIIHYQKDKLPFTFRWVDDQMVVIYNASQIDALKKGTVVHSINDISVEEIRNQLLKYVGADGATDGNRRYKLEVNGYDFRYNAFDIFYPLVFPIDVPLRLDVQQFGISEKQKVEVLPLTREERAEVLTSRYDDFPENKDDLWSFDLINDNTALLTINSFGLFGWKAMSLDYKKFLKDAFARLKNDGIGYLIIDIRKNTGGNDEIANELFSYLTSSNFDFDREGRTRYLEFPESLKPYIKTWGDNPWYFNLDPKDEKPSNGYFIFKENFKTDLKKDKKETYRGQSYLLTSNANTSLAFYTAYRFKLQKLGLIVGQETGGNLNDINGGQILFLRLPNSSIEIDFPVMGGFSTIPQPDMGVQPTIETKYSIEDIIDNKDLEIETVLEIINKEK